MSVTSQHLARGVGLAHALLGVIELLRGPRPDGDSARTLTGGLDRKLDAQTRANPGNDNYLVLE
jgi:hypothetical protein